MVEAISKKWQYCSKHGCSDLLWELSLGYYAEERGTLFSSLRDLLYTLIMTFPDVHEDGDDP